MKKLLTLLVAVMLLSGAMGVGKAQAYSFPVGDIKFLMDGYSYFYQVATDEGDSELRGVFNIARYQFEGSEYPTLVPEINIRFGGLKEEIDIISGGGTGYFSGGWAEMYFNEVGTYQAALNTINTTSLAGSTVFNSKDFALEFVTAPLILGLEFAHIYEGGQYSFKTLYDSIDNEYKNNAYLNAIDGLYLTSFDTNTRFGGTDLSFSAITTLSGLLNSQLQILKFDTESSSVTGHVVPEPGTILLLGAGLLGLAATARRRTRN
jgi:hypothetical protein